MAHLVSCGGALLGSLGVLWALLGLSWGSLGALLGSLGAPLGSLGHSWVCLGLSQGFQASSATLASRFPKLPGIQASPTCLRSSTCVFVSIVVGSCLVDKALWPTTKPLGFLEVWHWQSFLAYVCEWVPVWVCYLGPDLADLKPS